MPVTKHQTLALGEEKKHSVRYNAKPGEQFPIVTSIYIAKTHLTQPYPREISLSFNLGEAK